MKRLIRLQPLIWVPVVFLTDFATKRLVLAHDLLLRDKLQVLGNLLRFTYVRNPGSAMDLFPVGRFTLISISLLASVFLIFLYRHTAARLKVRRGAIAAILGGALGNLVDRIFYEGRVVDFIDIGLGEHRFYTFNIADMGVTLGGTVLFLSLLRESWTHRAERRRRREVASSAKGDVDWIESSNTGTEVGSQSPAGGGDESGSCV